MSKIIFIAALIGALTTLLGCQGLNMQRLNSPSTYSFYEANRLFDRGQYKESIEKYKEFIKKNPRHKLVPAAQLGIAWGLYQLSEFDSCYKILGETKVSESKIQDWITNLKKLCLTKLSPSQTSAISYFTIPSATNQEDLKLEALMPEGSTVTVNGKNVPLVNNLASTTVHLNEGENLITVGIKNKEGNVETHEATVTLDKTPPQLKDLDSYLDELGYIVVEGKVTKPSTVLANNEEASVDSDGKFSVNLRFSRGQPIQIKAQDLAGNIATQTFYPNTDVPLKPTGLRLIRATSNSAELDWNDNTEPDLKGYELFYGLQGSGGQDQVQEVITKHPYELVGLDPLTRGANRTFIFNLRAVDKMKNESDPSDPFEVTLPP